MNMEAVSMFLKISAIQLNYVIISTILCMNFIYFMIFGYSYSWIIFCFILFGIWTYCTKNDRKPIGQQDTIVITGCDSGLGYSLALHCYYNLNINVIAGIHNENSEGLKELRKIGIVVHPLDITLKESVIKFVKFVNNRLENEHLTLHSVVNNAGAMIFGEFEWQTDDQIYHQINVNLLGTMRLTKEILPLMRKYRSRLIIVTSHCAIEALPGVAAYGATKAGLAAWATSLRVELKKYNVEVVNFIPGSFIQDSNLLSQQKRQFEMMELGMLPETRQFYFEYFKRYTDYLLQLCQYVSPRKLNNPQLYEIFNDALLQRYPHSTYKCEPWRYMFYHILFKITPTHIRDWLIEQFIQMPTWKCNDSKTH